jgi:hypothetical protein
VSASPEELGYASAEAVRNLIEATSRPRLMDMWLLPIRKPLAQTAATVDKPLADMTVPDLMAWGIVLGYGGVTGYVLGKMLGNLLVAALGGPRRSR